MRELRGLMEEDNEDMRKTTGPFYAYVIDLARFIGQALEAQAGSAPEECEEKNPVDLGEFERVAALNPRFFSLLQRMAELHNSKQHDYCGQGYDPLANLRASEALGIPAWKGCLVRMSDKWMRIRNFARQDVMAVKDESFIDTCLDLAVYALHEIVLFNEQVAVDQQPEMVSWG